MAVRQKIQAGDVFVIGDADLQGEMVSLNKQNRLGKVVFKSKQFRGMIGMVISENIFDEIPTDVSEIKFVDKVFYSLHFHLRNGTWQIIGKQAVTRHEEDLTLRLVGSWLWRLDEELENVQAKDYKKYPSQGLCYSTAIYTAINQFVQDQQL